MPSASKTMLLGEVNKVEVGLGMVLVVFRAVFLYLRIIFGRMDFGLLGFGLMKCTQVLDLFRIVDATLAYLRQ